MAEKNSQQTLPNTQAEAQTAVAETMANTVDPGPEMPPQPSQEEINALAEMEKAAAETERPKPVDATSSTFKSIVDIVNKLKCPTGDRNKPLPDAVLKQRTQGGKRLTYIEHQTAVRYMDAYAPGWSSEITAILFEGGGVVVKVAVTVPCAEGFVTREDIGFEKISGDNKSYGDPVLNAKQQALKRCCAQFGLALYLYDK